MRRTFDGKLEMHNECSMTHPFFPREFGWVYCMVNIQIKFSVWYIECTTRSRRFSIHIIGRMKKLIIMVMILCVGNTTICILVRFADIWKYNYFAVSGNYASFPQIKQFSWLTTPFSVEKHCLFDSFYENRKYLQAKVKRSVYMLPKIYDMAKLLHEHNSCWASVPINWQ